ncbi:MAG: hypothetical protein LBS00_07695 [Synergistaceae bacterium]|jgi:hypothetical protein|nr:hypothetical protein [Synergistaceae bacterium]
MIVTPIDIGKMDFSPFGEHRRLIEARDVFKTDFYTCYVDFTRFLSGDWMIGYVESGLLPEYCVKMEKHKRDQSLMICGDFPMILPLAPAGNPSDLDEAPQADKVSAAILYPGDVALLNPGVWHDACYGLENGVRYYFLSKVHDTDIVVKTLAPGPVRIRR